MELERLADTVQGLLEKERLDGWEVMVSQSRDLSVEAKGGKLDAFRCAHPLGVAIRVLAGQGLGFSFSTTFEPSGLARMVDGALVAARTQSADPCHLLPGPASRYPEIPGLCDDDLALIPEDGKIGRALELERLVLAADPRVRRVRKCSYSESIYGLNIRNSLGLAAGYRGSYVSLSVSAVAEADGDAQTGWDFGFSSGLSGIDLDAIAAGAARKATSLLGARSIATMRCPAVFDNRIASDLLELVSASFLAESVHKGKSLFAGKVGEQVTSGVVTVRDNGVLPGGMGSAPCDGEGVPQQDTLLVSQGVLKGFLYDSYWGNRMGSPSTGNSLRAGVKGPPKMGVHNLFVEPGENPPEALLAGIGKGVLVTEVMGMHTANRISGDFSVGAAGFYVENGAVLYPVKGFAIAGNLIDLYRSVDMVADDLRFFGLCGSPSLRVGELDVSGT